MTDVAFTQLMTAIPVTILAIATLAGVFVNGRKSQKRGDAQLAEMRQNTKLTHENTEIAKDIRTLADGNLSKATNAIAVKDAEIQGLRDLVAEMKAKSDAAAAALVLPPVPTDPEVQ